HGASDIQAAQTTWIDSASTLNASATASGDGGTVAVWSNGATRFAGQISAAGAPGGGNGGYAEVSANPVTHGVLSFAGIAQLTAPKGARGTLLLDPFDIVISTGTDSGGSFSGGVWIPTATSVINNVTLENQLAVSNVIVSTGLAGSPGTDAGNLTVFAPISWSSSSSLTLEAFSNIFVGAPITATGAGSLTLTAATGFASILSPISMATGAVSVTGATGIGLAANITTSGGPVTLNDAVQLEANVTVNAGAGGVAFDRTVDSVVGSSGPCFTACDLTVTGSTISLGGAAGGSSPLGTVSLTSTNGMTLQSIHATRDVTLSAGGFANLLGAISTTTGAVAVTGGTGIGLAANVTTSGGAIRFNNPAQLEGNVSISSGAGGVAFGGTVNSAPAFPGSGLSVTAGSISFGGAWGGTSPLGAVSLTSTFGTMFLPSISATGDIALNGFTALTGNITSSGGSILFSNAATLQSNVTLSAPSGAVTFDSTVDTGFSTSCGAACDLTVSASAITFGGALGGSSPLGAVSLTSTGSLTLPPITASALTADSTAGGISLNGAAGISGTAILSAAGDIVQNAGAAITAGSVNATSTGGQITLDDSISSTGDVALTAAGNIAQNFFGSLRAATVDATSTAGQIVLNDFITSSGNVVLSAAGDIIENIVAAITAPAVSATSKNGKAVLTGGGGDLPNRVGSIFGSAPLGFSFNDGDPMSIAGITTTTGPIFLESGAFGFAGSISQTGPIRGAALFAEANGDILLNNPNNSVGTLAGAASSAAPIRFQFANNNGANLAIGTVNYFVSDINDGAALTPASGVTAAAPGAGIEISNVGNLVLDSAINSGSVTATVALAATGNFINNVGPGAIVDPWQIYSASPAGDFFNGLDSGNTAVWHTTFGQPVTAAGNRYIFAFQPTITVTSISDAKTYGQDVTARVATDFVISGLEPGVPGAFLGDSAAAVFGGTPLVTSLGSPARAPVTGSPYPITVGQGSFTVSDNYALVLDSAGKLTVDPLALTYAVADATSIYGTTATLGAATLFGVLAGDTVVPTVGLFSGTIPVALGPRTPVGVYSEQVMALSNPDYTLAATGNTPGRLTVEPLALTYAVADATSFFGSLPILGAATLFGVLPGDIVIPTVGAFRGLAPVPLTPFTPVGRYAELVTGLSNPDYRIAPAPNFPGVLTIAAATANPGAPSDPGFLPGLTQINDPAPTVYDVGGYDQVLPHLTVACNEPPSLPDPNRFSDPDQALRSISNAMENYFRRCQNPTQTTIADALDEYADKLQVLAPRLPPALRNVPAIVAEGARRVRAARSRSEAVAVLRQTIATVHKEIALVLSEDPETRSRETRDGAVVAGALEAASATLVTSGGL
ncbi:MAG: hypothetical protein JO288_14825, partial [Hyphomicrobiales bacterium]|nr:hypothetical protein [Hyphomicrobiales bacterium]